MVKSVLADLLAGFLVLCLFIAGMATGVMTSDFRPQLIFAGALFLIAGWIRGAARPSNPWIKGVLVSLGAGVPICILAFTGDAFTSKPHLVIFLAVCLLAPASGVHVRRLWRSAHPAASVAVAAISATLVVLTGQLLVPAILENASTRHVKYSAPSFSLDAPDGGNATGDSLHGRVAVLVFWATWCAPCREELPRLNALYDQYRNNPNVAFLAVDTEREEDPACNKAKAFFAKSHLSLPLFAADDQTRQKLGASGLPALVVIDQDGNIRLIHIGYDGAERLERMLNGQIAALLGSAKEGRSS